MYVVTEPGVQIVPKLEQERGSSFEMSHIIDKMYLSIFVSNKESFVIITQMYQNRINIYLSVSYFYLVFALALMSNFDQLRR